MYGLHFIILLCVFGNGIEMGITHGIPMGYSHVNEKLGNVNGWEEMGIDCTATGGNVNVKIHSRSSLE